jgi:hypothetical protein
MLRMSGPLDDAFAEAAARREREETTAREERAAVGRLSRAWVEAYREVLEAVPRHVQDTPRTILLAWDRGREIPDAIAEEGDMQHSVHWQQRSAYGSCQAWSFARGPEDEKGRRPLIFVSADCTTVFTIGDYSMGYVRSGLRKRPLTAYFLRCFADTASGRHDLDLRVRREWLHRLDAPPGDQRVPGEYVVSRCALPDVQALARIIAGL